MAQGSGGRWQVEKLYDETRWRLEYFGDMRADPGNKKNGSFAVGVSIDGGAGFEAQGLYAEPGEDITFMISISVPGAGWKKGKHTIELMCGSRTGEVGVFVLHGATEWRLFEELLPPPSEAVRVS